MFCLSGEDKKTLPDFELYHFDLMSKTFWTIAKSILQSFLSFHIFKNDYFC